MDGGEEDKDRENGNGSGRHRFGEEGVGGKCLVYLLKELFFFFFFFEHERDFDIIILVQTIIPLQ